MTKISPSLKEQVAIQIFAKVANKHYRISSLCLELGRATEAYKENPTKQIWRQQADLYIRAIVSRMITDLQEPDAVIIEQYDPGRAMYLIAKGECQVTVGEEASSDGNAKKKDKKV